MDTAAIQTKINKQATLMIGMLSAQLLLGMAENLIGKPDGLHGSEKALSSAFLLLHVLIGLALIGRGIFAVRSAAPKSSQALRLARIGLAGVLTAFVAGVLTIAITAGDSWWSYIMTIGFLAAFLAYGKLLSYDSKRQ